MPPQAREARMNQPLSVAFPRNQVTYSENLQEFHDFFESTAVVAYYYTNYNEMKIRLTHAIEYFLLTAEHFSVLLNCIEVYVQMNIITTFFDTMMAKRAQRETSSP